MASTLRKIGVRFMAAGLFLAAASAGAGATDASSPAAQGSAADAPEASRAVAWEGRWQQVPVESGHRLDVGTIEIARCAGSFCGRLVTNDACGPVMMTLTADGDRLGGQLTLHGRTFEAGLLPEGTEAGRITLLASESASFVSRNSMTLEVEFIPKGPAACTPAPSS